MALCMQYLLTTTRKPDDTAYSIDEVARGTGVSLTYLRNMLAGRQDNPSRKVIAALARFFNVSPAYFFERSNVPQPAEHAPASEIEVALRSAEHLGPDGRRILLDMIRLAQRISGRRDLDA
ncbi:MAG: helix-turn-helix transcriptional regulator [Chloroflexi bacterium]|nr:helix-turn-helix transcriptional regulator [Chloroflexota bacterium]